jgi:hypothetical protein
MVDIHCGVKKVSKQNKAQRKYGTSADQMRSKGHAGLDRTDIPSWAQFVEKDRLLVYGSEGGLGLFPRDFRNPIPRPDPVQSDVQRPQSGWLILGEYPD